MHSPAMATKSKATLDKKEYMSQDRFSKWHLEEPPALLAVPGRKLQHRRDEAEAVCDHCPLHHIQLGKDNEDEQRKTNYVHRLKDEDNKKVGEGGTPAGLEQADPEASDESAELWDEEGEEETSSPGNSLRGGQLRLVLPPSLQVVAAIFYRPGREKGVKM